jgi:hypothetical protein
LRQNEKQSRTLFAWRRDETGGIAVADDINWSRSFVAIGPVLGRAVFVHEHGRRSMCDYSLHDVASRPASVGDKLVSARFNNSITRGFASFDQPNVAVCMLPGTELAFDHEVECDANFRFLPNRKFRTKWRGFGKSTWTTPLPITMRWNFPGARQCL